MYIQRVSLQQMTEALIVNRKCFREMDYLFSLGNICTTDADNAKNAKQAT